MTFPQVAALVTEMALSMGVSHPLWLGYDDKIDDSFYAYVDQHYKIDDKSYRRNGFIIVVTPKLLKLNEGQARKHIKHELCHIILDADVIGWKWKSLSEAEKASRHRAVETCIATRFEGK